MRLVATPIPGAFLLELDLLRDQRGWFARSWCAAEFAAHGLDAQLSQCNISFNDRAGTLRGMHFQAEPRGEAKVVRCTRGAIHDVIVDLRRDSPAFRRWHAVELSADNHRALYIPRGVAHGFQTHCDGCEVHYQMSEPFSAAHSSGVRWDDPAFGIAWPDALSRIISDKDQSYPDFGP